MATDLAVSNWAARAYTELPETGVVEGDADFETVTNRIDTTGQSVEFIRVDVEEL